MSCERVIRIGPLVAFAAALIACLPACGRRDAHRPDGPTRVVVTIPPLLSLAKALAPADAQVTSLTPPGVSEHTYEAPPTAVASMLEADVVVTVGLGLEPRVQAALTKHPCPWRRTVVFSDAVGLGGEGAHNHDDPADGHDVHHDDAGHHGGVDPHLWLDPSLVERFIPALRGAIEASLRERGLLTAPERARLEAAEKSLIDQARAVDAEYKAALAAVPVRVLLTHHDAYSRLAARYNLRVVAVLRPVSVVEPTPGDVQRAADAIRTGGVRAIFVEPQFSAAAAERIAQLTGATVVPLDPLGDGDWAKMMRTNLGHLVEGLSGAAP